MENKNNMQEFKVEKREYFRVDDMLPIIFRKLQGEAPPARSRLLPGFSQEYAIPASYEEPPDGAVSPQLWEMLVEINAKLGLILNKLSLDSEGLTKAEPRQVSLSSSGVKFTTGEMFGLDDLMEVKILLPLNPPVWIAVYGKVVRVEVIGNEQYDVALRFSDLDDEVCEAINQYTLKRQRELIRKQKEL